MKKTYLRPCLHGSHSSIEGLIFLYLLLLIVIHAPVDDKSAIRDSCDPLVGAQGAPNMYLKNHLRLHKVPSLRATNLKNKLDKIFLRSESNSVAWRNVADQLVALYSLPLWKYTHLNYVGTDHKHTFLWLGIAKKRGSGANFERPYLKNHIECDFYLFLFVLVKVQHFHKVSWKSEGVSWGDFWNLVDWQGMTQLCLWMKR